MTKKVLSELDEMLRCTRSLKINCYWRVSWHEGVITPWEEVQYTRTITLAWLYFYCPFHKYNLCLLDLFCRWLCLFVISLFDKDNLCLCWRYQFIDKFCKSMSWACLLFFLQMTCSKERFSWTMSYRDNRNRTHERWEGMSLSKFNPLRTVTPKMGTISNIEDPDKMPLYVAFHQGLLKSIFRERNM